MRHIKIIIILLSLMVSAKSYSQQSVQYYFNKAATEYYNGNDKAASKTIKEGFKSYPSNSKLLELGKVLGVKPYSKVKCPSGDKDQDGVCDDMDSCPDDRGPASNKGCPVKPIIKVEKDSPTSNTFKLSSSNGRFNEINDKIKVHILKDGKTYYTKTLVPSDIRASKFTVSGPELKEAMGSASDNLTVKIKVELNGKRYDIPGNFTIHCSF